MIGASGDNIDKTGSVNEATIKFTPKTNLDPKDGLIRIYAEPNYKSLETGRYQWREKGFVCSSEHLSGITTQADSEGEFPYFDVKYESTV